MMEAPLFVFFKQITIPFMFVFILFSSEFETVEQASALGINYGQIANNLPSPDHVLRLLTSLHITKARIYDANPKILSAFANSTIELIVTVPNEALPWLASPTQAAKWIATNITPFIPNTKITGIAVGNEVFTCQDSALIGSVMSAMVGIRRGLAEQGLDSVIHVSTASSLAVLANSYPPSMGSFRPELAEVMGEFLRFLSETGSPFWINAYPYFAYKGDPERVPLEYVLFESGSGMLDPNTGLEYDNMLYAQVDAVIFAIARFGYGDIQVSVSETGWPSKGDEDEMGATVENAMIYNRNLVARQLENEGTPVRPTPRLEVYLFALFNEDLKPGPTSERNYGLYQPDGTMTYNVGLSAATSTASVSAINSSASRTRGVKLKRLWYCIIAISLTFQISMR
ncbi:glucan endo-1,3-beta-glucosidase 14 isoform X2 [Phalaenopsis equestris]|uniref:glucan endo-1,3-beta-glucosidase 14 isoform X2 n=1 Tax=Phalaenopsis equestris TaxID=78828 RepID=UPI0009E2F093|nr:glucan endo-1,3-beta-glucosidase 14 isoform X2 [Phalaenopsis equestris]